MTAYIAKWLESRAYIWLAPVFVVAVLALFVTKVDLRPQIAPDFFFSSDSEIYQQDRQIQQEFPFQQQILLNVTTDSIFDPNYREKIRILTGRLQGVPGVDSVYSMTNGPDDIEAARENPLWRRLLMGKDEKSSAVIVFIGGDDFETIIHDIEEIVAEEENQWFSIRMSGLPYIVEQIRRNLSSDMKNFTAGAVILSAVVLFFVFRSFLVVIGALITCLTAAMLTLVMQAFMGIPIGILTANLGAIVFVLTQSHLIFIIANWYNEKDHEEDRKLAVAVRHTLPASFWAMLTTLLGFASLVFVEAKPLNELGTGGAVGTFAALVCAYTVFPAFLRAARVRPSAFTYSLARNFPLPRKVALVVTLVTILAASGIGVAGLAKVNTDPSLLTYFKGDSALYDGLYHIDDNGGSNPLTLVIRRDDGRALDNDESYKRLWGLQEELAAHEEVGSVISLPVIMAEGDEHWLGQWLPWNMLLDILSKPEYGAIARSFVNEQRTEALFMLRMKEAGRDRDRLSIIAEIEAIPSRHGFTVAGTGGTYYLQGELASSVAQSMMRGILTLIVLFGVIALIVARSVAVAGAMMICAAAVAALVLGTVGLFGIPVDIISSPAVNICLGLIVDDMIHLTVAARRSARRMKGEGRAQAMRQEVVWRQALNTQSWPAIISTLTIMIGFSVFGLSDFPPSQRFGLEIVYGAGLAVLLALAVFPYLGGGLWRVGRDTEKSRA